MMHRLASAVLAPVLALWAAWSHGVDEGLRIAYGRDWPAPPLCADRWERITVPTCDGGVQTMHAEAP